MQNLSAASPTSVLWISIIMLWKEESSNSSSVKPGHLSTYTPTNKGLYWKPCLTLQSCLSTELLWQHPAHLGNLRTVLLTWSMLCLQGMLQALINVSAGRTSNEQQGRLALFPLQGNARDSGDPTKPPEGDVRTGAISLHCCWKSVQIKTC